MLKTIQIIALLQGIFLVIILFVKRKEYKRLNFWLLFITIISLLIHIIGDDDFNLIQADANWYFFHAPLIITLFFLLIKYDDSNRDTFQMKDLLYFIPHVIYIGTEILEETFHIENSDDEKLGFIIAEIFVTATMLWYLGIIVYRAYKDQKKQWMLYFIIPYAIVTLLDATSYFIFGKPDTMPYLESYGIIAISGLLLYAILFKLVVSPKSILPKAETKAYKTSSLQTAKVAGYKKEFIRLMEEEKMFTDRNLTVNQVAQKMGIPRQHLSEVLNVHIKSNFQDYINKCRAEEFVRCLEHKKFANYTIIGIANEVGFKSKSSFNTTFKKLYGVTPSVYRKSLN
ncbi:MAG: helix-turn-helix transcriptional regulator [Bacteroidota bacterium]